MTRIVWTATLTETFRDVSAIRHSFSGNYDAGGEWVTPADALKAIGMAVWNFIDACGEAADDFEITINLEYVKEATPAA